jgi:hypothetical protein
MTKEQLDTLQGVVFTTVEGAAFFLPVIGPFIPYIEGLFSLARNHGLVPVELSVDQINAIGAAQAAARSSAVTHYIMSQHKDSK